MNRETAQRYASYCLGEAPKGLMELQVLLPITGLVDLDALSGRLEKDIAKTEKEIKVLAGRLANPSFASKAPPEVVAECRANLADAEAQAALARGRLGLGRGPVDAGPWARQLPPRRSALSMVKAVFTMETIRRHG